MEFAVFMFFGSSPAVNVFDMEDKSQTLPKQNALLEIPTLSRHEGKANKCK